MLNDGLYPSSLLRKGLNGKSPNSEIKKKEKKKKKKKKKNKLVLNYQEAKNDKKQSYRKKNIE